MSEIFGKKRNVKSGHTQGPWAIGYGGMEGDNYATITSKFSDYPIAELNPIGYNRANAQLIATAPELLDAAKRAFALIKESGFKSGLTEDEFDATLNQLSVAIEKSEK